MDDFKDTKLVFFLIHDCDKVETRVSVITQINNIQRIFATISVNLSISPLVSCNLPLVYYLVFIPFKKIT